MPKYELITRAYDLDGNPVGPQSRRVIDPEVDRMYDGAISPNDIKKTFLEAITQDPIHKVVIKVDSVHVLDK